MTASVLGNLVDYRSKLDPVDPQINFVRFSCLRKTFMKFSWHYQENCKRIYEFMNKSSAIMQKGKSRNGCFKKTKHAQFSTKMEHFSPPDTHT